MALIKPQDTRAIYNRLKSSAKKRNIPFNLTLCDLNNLSFPISCPILDIPLAYNTGAPQDNSYSIDRKDSTKGYELDNIIVISFKANRLKNSLTPQQIKRMNEWYN